MGVDYRAVLMVGKVVDYDDEALELLDAAGLSLTDEQREAIEADGLSEFLYGEKFHGLDCEVLNAYSGWGRALGFGIRVQPVESFADRVKEAQQKWRDLFGNEGDIVHTAMVY